MAGNLLSRLDKIEATLPSQEKPWRCIAIMCDQGERAHRLAEAEGYGLADDSNDFIMIWEAEWRDNCAADPPFQPYVM